MRYFNITVSILSSNVLSWKKNFSFSGKKHPTLDHIKGECYGRFVCDQVVVDNIQEMNKEDYETFFTGKNWEDISI